jgi:hypothetical protein
MSIKKIAMTPSGIEPATFRLVAQCPQPTALPAACPLSSQYSVEIPTRCSLVIEFIIPEFIEGSTCFERHTAHYQEL